MVIDIACGRQPSFQKEGKKAEVRFIMNQEGLKELKKIQKVMPECLYRISNIQPVNDEKQISDSSARYGYYIIQG